LFPLINFIFFYIFCSGIPISIQRLTFCGRQLIDELTLNEYGIDSMCTLDLLLSLFGGGSVCSLHKKQPETISPQTPRPPIATVTIPTISTSGAEHAALMQTMYKQVETMEKILALVQASNKRHQYKKQLKGKIKIYFNFFICF
jgi:hypothetical protein